MSVCQKTRESATIGGAKGFLIEGSAHLCNGLVPERDGGMVPSILGFTGALAAKGGRVRIGTPTVSAVGEFELPPGVELEGPLEDLEGVVREARVVHLHGLWQGHTRRGARVARRLGVPYLIAAHGMAEPWALRQKALKKRLYTALVEGKNLREASCLHALSRPEVGHLRALAPRTPVCLVPNGVNPDPFDHLPDRQRLEEQHPELAGKDVTLFFGRLHVKKGLDLLAPAFGVLAKEFPELHLLMAGRDDGAWGPFRDQVERLGLVKRVTYVGHVSGASAREVWAAADSFILPSYSEGFSMAVLEAMACRLPAMITTGCHFPDAGQAGASIVVEPTREGVVEGWKQLLGMPPVARETMGQRGRELVERAYTWERQAERLAEVYRWVTDGGELPEAVRDAELQEASL